MKLTIDIKTLLAALNRAKPVASGRTTLPALSCFLLTATDKLTVAANNLDLFISTDAECIVKEPGSVCVSARKLCDVISALGSGEAEIEVDKKHFVSIRRGAACIKLWGVEGKEFPAWDEMKHDGAFIAPADKLGDALSMVAPMQCDEASRYVLCGIAFQSEGGKLLLIGTNGRGLALATPEIPAENIELIVPTGAVNMLLSLLEKGDVEISWNDSVMRARCGAWTVATRLVEGEFPNWRQVIPKKKAVNVSVTMNRASALDALSISRTTIDTDKSAAVKLLATTKGVSFASNIPDVGESSIPVEGSASKEIAIAFDARYLRDGLEAFSGEELKLQLESECSAGKIEDSTGLFVLIPMRIS